MLEGCGRFAMVADVSRLVRKTREGSRCFSKFRRHAVAHVAVIRFVSVFPPPFAEEPQDLRSLITTIVQIRFTYARLLSMLHSTNFLHYYYEVAIPMRVLPQGA
jgi:hypothetical protein